MLYLWVILLFTALIIGFVYYGNYRINKHFASKQEILFRDLLNYDHHVFRNITMKTFGRTPLGKRSRLFISHVAFIENSVVVIPHKTNSRRELVQCQPLLQFMLSDKPKKLAGISFYQRLNQLSLKETTLILEYVRTDQLVNVDVRVELDFRSRGNQLKIILERMKYNV